MEPFEGKGFCPCCLFFWGYISVLIGVPVAIWMEWL